MSQQSARTKALKEIFEAAKKSPKKYGFPIDNYLRNDLNDALFAVGKEKIYELKEEVFPFLKEDNPYFRARALRILGYNNGDGLNIPEIKELAYEFWLNDPDDDVRAAALDEWGKCHAFSKDPKVLQYLYNIFYSDEYPSYTRMRALINFVYVADEMYSREFDEIFGLCRIKDSKLFLETMNMKFSDKIENIMKKYVIKSV